LFLSLVVVKCGRRPRGQSNARGRARGRSRRRRLPSRPQARTGDDRGPGRMVETLAAWRSRSARLASVRRRAHGPAPRSSVLSGRHGWSPVSLVCRPRQQGNLDPQPLAQVAGGRVQRQVVHARPQVQLIAPGSAHEATKGVFLHVGRERTTAGRMRTVDRTRPAKLVASPPHRGKLQQFQNASQGDGVANRTVVKARHVGSLPSGTEEKRSP
jgi:hypothetical protein